MFCLAAVRSAPSQKHNNPTATKQPIHGNRTNSFMFILCHWSQCHSDQCWAASLAMTRLMWKIGDVTLFLDLFHCLFTLILGSSFRSCSYAVTFSMASRRLVYQGGQRLSRATAVALSFSFCLEHKLGNKGRNVANGRFPVRFTSVAYT